MRRAGTPPQVSPSPTRLPGMRTEWARIVASASNVNVTHNRCGETDGCPVTDDYRCDNKIAIAAVVGKNPYASPEGHIVTQRDKLGVRDILRIDKGMSAEFHPHGFEEPYAKGRQGYKRQKGETHKVK